MGCEGNRGEKTLKISQAEIDEVSHLNYSKSRRAEDFQHRSGKQQQNFLDRKSAADSANP